jgi:hypothetical protein
MSKEIFISHAWGNDSLNRDNHLRCNELAKKLINCGYKVWFDSNDLYGNIDSSIIKGINNSKIVLVCLTNNYCNKINNAVHMQCPNDNCFKEWNYSLFKKKTIIPILMEPTMKETFLNGDGVIQMYLNSTMFIDMTDNINNDFDILKKTLRRFNVYNKDEKKIYKIKDNSSFDNLSLIFTNVIKNISPRSPTERSPNNKKNKFKYILNKPKILAIVNNKFKRSKLLIKI